MTGEEVLEKKFFEVVNLSYSRNLTNHENSNLDARFETIMVSFYNSAGS